MTPPPPRSPLPAPRSLLSALRSPLSALRSSRRGATLVWFALLLVVLLGMAGLVIDAGMLLSARRQAQNAADAAATAAATDLLNGKSADFASATAVKFVKGDGSSPYNGIPASAPGPEVHIPPSSGDYAGQSGYAEVIVTYPVNPFLIHVLPGVSSDANNVRARAVAGSIPITAGAGVAVLNPYVRGLTVMGSSSTGKKLWVEGLVIVNSEGKGYDWDGTNVGINANYVAAASGPNSPAYATKFHMVGGVALNDRANFRSTETVNNPRALFGGQLPMPDPLLNLDTPSVANGVLNVDRGAPQATNLNLKGDTSGRPGVQPGVRLESGMEGFNADLFTGQPYLQLYPGIYSSIDITGGNVNLDPGIYVIRPLPNVTTALKITGGNVIANGIMFYNTGHNYNATDGTPDKNDGNKPPPQWGADSTWDNPDTAAITINAGMKFSPIDTSKYDYPGQNQIDTFDGMLFYQRRRNLAGVDLQGDSAEGYLNGTIYAKWAPVKVAGSGTYDAQFVIGSLTVDGIGQVTVMYAGKKTGKAPQVFLVE